MTYCTTIAKPLLKKIKEKKTLDEIGAELCGNAVKNPRQKAIRLIRELLGEETLIQYAETLKYDIEKAKIGKKPKKSLRKIKTNADNEFKDSSSNNQYAEMTLTEVIKTLEELINKTSITTFVSALDAIKEKHAGLQQ